MRIEHQPDNSHPFSLKHLTREEVETIRRALAAHAPGPGGTPNPEHALACELTQALRNADRHPDSRIL